MNLSKYDSSYYCNLIKNSLINIYKRPMQKLISRCISPEMIEDSAIIFKDNLVNLSKAIKMQLSNQYDRFRGNFEKPIYLKRGVETMNFLFTKTFSKMNINKIEEIDEKELFLSIFINTATLLFENLYLFDSKGLSKFEKSKAKSEIVKLITDGIKNGIDFSFSQIFITNFRHERLSSLKTIVLNDNTKVEVPEHKLLKLIQEVENEKILNDKYHNNHNNYDNNYMKYKESITPEKKYITYNENSSDNNNNYMIYNKTPYNNDKKYITYNTNPKSLDPDPFK